jgi:hypothetical protein
VVVAVVVALAWQPARCSLSTAVCASQPGPHQNPPAAVSEAWVAAQRAWVDVALNQPVKLSGRNAKGECPQARVTSPYAPIRSRPTRRSSAPPLHRGVRDPSTSPCITTTN